MPETAPHHLSAYDFVLPPERIASAPMEPRARARLLRVTSTALTDHRIADLPELLRPNDLLVLNDTKVIPARLYGQRGTVKIELLLHKPRPDPTQPTPWLAFARPGKRLRVGDHVTLAPNFAAEILAKQEQGEVLLRFNVPDAELPAHLERHGHVPLPPYIKRPQGDTESDRKNYQTIYAQHQGAVAAPTAGLHFTPDLLQRLAAKGIQRAQVTLHVGAGTFLPVKTDNIHAHVMHAETGIVTPEAAAQINAARAAGSRIVAVGTTALRLLESAADDQGFVQPFNDETAIFITPGYKFKTADALLTNFHLPKSTLFMLVAAFAGLARMQEAYAHAIAQNYRFYSYGDATLLERNP